jgi:hypothetical protein
MTVSGDATMKAISCMSDQGFIGETEANSGAVISQFSILDNRGWFVVKEDSV